MGFKTPSYSIDLTEMIISKLQEWYKSESFLKAQS